jgi:3-oxoacyl-[acyl-carrier-protein] synthase III
MTSVGILGVGAYSFAQIERAAGRALRTGIPEPISSEKTGIWERHIARASLICSFMRVIRDAVEKGGASPADVRCLSVIRTKRSFYLEILKALGLSAEQSIHLGDYERVQSSGQALALQLGLARGKIKAGDPI